MEESLWTCSMQDYGKKYVQLGERLSKLSQVTRYDEGEDKEAWTLAHAFLDLEESFNRFINEQLAKLKNENLTNEQVYDILLDIGNNFMHILYHIHDPKFYDHLKVNPTQK